MNPVQEKALRVTRNRHYKELGVLGVAGLDIATRLIHPNLLHVDRIVTDHPLTNESKLALVTALAVGDAHGLEKELFKRNRSDVIRMAYQIISATQFLHSHNYLHLDISSPNVLITTFGDAVLADFDLSSRVHTVLSSSRVTMPVYSTYFRPPELLKETGKTFAVSAASDAWALGILMLFLLGGGLPEKLDKTSIDVENQIYLYINKWFQPDQQLRHSLNTWLAHFTDTKLRDQVVNVLVTLLQVDSTKRALLSTVLTMPVFKSLPLVVGTVTSQSGPDINSSPCMASVYRMYAAVVHMVRLFQRNNDAYGPHHCPVGIVFLAVDLLYRTTDMNLTTATSAILTHQTACHMLAWKYYNMYSTLENCSNVIRAFADIHVIDKKDLLEAEIAVIQHLKGAIWRPAILEQCRWQQDIRHCIRQVLPDMERYRTFDSSTVCNSAVGFGTGATPIGQMSLFDILDDLIPI